MIIEVMFGLVMLSFIAAVAFMLKVFFDKYDKIVSELSELKVDLSAVKQKQKDSSFDGSAFLGKDGLYSYEAYQKKLSGEDQDEEDALHQAFDELEE